MKSATLFKEYIWLVNTIHRHKRLTFDEINQHWIKTEMSGGLPMARSSFNRHRDAILDMFGIIIDCDKKDGYRYHIANAEVLTEETIQNWMLSTLSVNNVLAESLGVHERIILERIPSDGEHLHRFIDAMKQSVRIVLRYRRYGTDDTSLMHVEPYLVKLFNKRWYALVRHSEDGGLFTLAFDRIVSLELTVTPDYTDFELTLRPTADFITPLLSRGAAIKVLSPEWLAQTVRQGHLDAARLYE